MLGIATLSPVLSPGIAGRRCAGMAFPHRKQDRRRLQSTQGTSEYLKRPLDPANHPPLKVPCLRGKFCSRALLLTNVLGTLYQHAIPCMQKLQNGNH
mmetsp:Transcript_68175/g.134644  ORF Transcript_68175/g.134644 Transcript_68175/m.134644 type:complete len:97 (-) Transcript_68175:38-328(-)